MPSGQLRDSETASDRHGRRGGFTFLARCAASRQSSQAQLMSGALYHVAAVVSKGRRVHCAFGSEPDTCEKTVLLRAEV